MQISENQSLSKLFRCQNSVTTYFSVSLVPFDGPVVFKLLKAFNHFDFMLAFEMADSFRSRALFSMVSNFAANSSFWTK